MRLEGLHHITMITGDAQRNVDFYAGVLGLRLVKRTVNFDDPRAYHLYFGDESGTPGSILTWFEYADAQPGRAGLGMVHTIQFGVTDEAALDFWVRRLREHGHDSERDAGSLRFADFEGLGLELVIADAANVPLRAVHPDIPAEFALTGVEGARAYSSFANVEERLLTDTLGFSYSGEGRYRIDGDGRSVRWTLDQPTHRGVPGAGTVHHIAWASTDADHLDWQRRVADAGGFVTDVQDRDYFDAIYFREPRGVLFEIATIGPGFATDEDPEHLGEELRVPKMHASLRDELEATLTPLTNPVMGRRVA